MGVEGDWCCPGWKGPRLYKVISCRAPLPGRLLRQLAPFKSLGPWGGVGGRETVQRGSKSLSTARMHPQMLRRVGTFLRPAHSSQLMQQ